ncbi:MAG: hypothetical protein IIA41_11600, partial [SAR324 cluster bacterium]|nr:hypothetical protein [SAR324 cluster bacterium]
MAKDRRIDPTFIGQQTSGARRNLLSRSRLDAGVSMGLAVSTAFTQAKRTTLGRGFATGAYLDELQRLGTPLDKEAVGKRLAEAGIAPAAFDLPDRVTDLYLEDRIKAKRIEFKRNAIISAGSTSVTANVGIIGANLLATMTDPVELATL